MLEFKGDGFPYFTKLDYPLSLSFSGGLFLDVILTRNRRKLSICNELVYTSFRLSGQYEDVVYENDYTIYNTTFGLSYIKMNNMVRFKYPVGKFFIFINGGITNGIAVSEKNYLKEETRFYSTITFKEGKALDNVWIYEFGLIGGLGIRFKMFSIEARYERGNGFSDYVSVRSSTNRFYFLMGWKF